MPFFPGGVKATAKQVTEYIERLKRKTLLN